VPVLPVHRSQTKSTGYLLMNRRTIRPSGFTGSKEGRMTHHWNHGSGVLDVWMRNVGALAERRRGNLAELTARRCSSWDLNLRPPVLDRTGMRRGTTARTGARRPGAACVAELMATATRTRSPHGPRVNRQPQLPLVQDHCVCQLHHTQLGVTVLCDGTTVARGFAILEYSSLFPDL